MSVEIVSNQETKVTLQITIDLQGSLLESEQSIQEAVNEVGVEATRLSIQRFDTDGSAIRTGEVNWTLRCRSPKLYQTPYGAVEVERNVYQTSRGGKSYVPLESAARIITCSTPKFSKTVSSKYARLNAKELCDDLLGNHGRKISRGTIQSIAESIGSIAQSKEESWNYTTPVQDSAIETVVCSLDGAYLNTVDDGWREAMVGSISLYDCEGKRQHSVYFGAAPEYGKERFFNRYEQELSHIKALYPTCLYLGIADGSSSNWSFLKQHTDEQMLDFFHASEYLAKVAYAAHPGKTDKPQRQLWTKERCHQLKHDFGAAEQILREMKGFKRKRKLSDSVREDLQSAITYFTNQLKLMDYASHVEKNLPIGSGVVEAACKTLIKQRFCRSGMRWKEAGIKAVLSLRSLVQTATRWDQFWEKIDRFGVVHA